MKTKTDISSPIIKTVKKWKKEQAIISVTLDEMLDIAKNKKLISEQKVDGQTGLLDYDGSTARFGTLGGVIYWDLPVLNEIASILKAKGINQAQMVGEMAGYADNKIIPFNESESIIKNPRADKNKIHWFPYQILKIDKNDYDIKDFETYMRLWPQLKKIFGGSKFVHPVKDYEGGIKEIKESWKQLVEKDKNEGIVIRTEDNKVYKVKPTFNYDLVIIAVGSKKGKNWPKKQIGMALLAFMDGDKVFRTAGHVSSGFDDAEGKELFSWAQKNKTDEDDVYIWVKPEKIIEVQWERTSIKEMPSYKYSNGKYEKIEKRMSGTVVKPRFIRYRMDKSVTPEDLRLTQIPGWVEKQKRAHKVASLYIEAIIKKLHRKDRDDRPSEEQQWGLYTSDGSRLLGRHPTKEKALKQERAVQYYKHRSADIKWGCVGCKKNTLDEPSYMINDALWKKLGLNDNDNLCFNCLEKMIKNKLGRNLQKSDFSQYTFAHVNEWNPKVKEILS